MKPAREEALYTSLLKIPDRLMTDSHGELDRPPASTDVDAICEVFQAA